MDFLAAHAAARREGIFFRRWRIACRCVWIVGRVLRDGPKAGVLTSRVISDVFGVEVDIEERGGFYGAW